MTHTWARRGQQPKVPTSGKRKGYKVLGLIDYFSGRFRLAHSLINRFDRRHGLLLIISRLRYGMGDNQ